MGGSGGPRQAWSVALTEALSATLKQAWSGRAEGSGGGEEVCLGDCSSPNPGCYGNEQEYSGQHKQWVPPRGSQGQIGPAGERGREIKKWSLML